ncbi:IclR family transcriptional regulator [Streptosporangium sp. NPDC051022]|uniref:IclR family transcriptional regulator n=1 Tax=Streptosporangium sp. NPDC051022 TaxID=3155752 RepID=UPI003423448B
MSTTAVKVSDPLHDKNSAGRAPGTPVTMVERVALILEAFGGQPGWLSLEAISQRTRLPRSTAHRILDQLLRVRWLEHSSWGYALGPRLLELCGQDNSDSRLRTAADPILRELRDRTGMVVHLGVPERDQVRYLAKYSVASFAVPSQVGALVPMHASALGKAYLACLKPERIGKILGDNLERRTSRTICDLSHLHADLARVRERRGIAYEKEECVPRLACVASAVHSKDGPLGSVSLVTSAETGSLSRMAPLVVRAARRITETLLSGA